MDTFFTKSSMNFYAPVSIQDLPVPDKDDPDARCCCICGGELSTRTTNSSEQPVKIDCGHVFGERCLTEWLGQKSTCPTCRQHPTPDTVKSEPGPAFFRRCYRWLEMCLIRAGEAKVVEREASYRPHGIRMEDAIQLIEMCYLVTNVACTSPREEHEDLWSWYRDSDAHSLMFSCFRYRAMDWAIPQRDPNVAWGGPTWLDSNVKHCVGFFNRNCRPAQKIADDNKPAHQFIRDTMKRILDAYVCLEKYGVTDPAWEMFSMTRDEAVAQVQQKIR